MAPRPPERGWDSVWYYGLFAECFSILALGILLSGLLWLGFAATRSGHKAIGRVVLFAASTCLAWASWSLGHLLDAIANVDSPQAIVHASELHFSKVSWVLLAALFGFALAIALLTRATRTSTTSNGNTARSTRWLLATVLCVPLASHYGLQVTLRPRLDEVDNSWSSNALVLDFPGEPWEPDAMSASRPGAARGADAPKQRVFDRGMSTSTLRNWLADPKNKGQAVEFIFAPAAIELGGAPTLVFADAFERAMPLFGPSIVVRVGESTDAKYGFGFPIHPEGRATTKERTENLATDVDKWAKLDPLQPPAITYTFSDQIPPAELFKTIARVQSKAGNATKTPYLSAKLP